MTTQYDLYIRGTDTVCNGSAQPQTQHHFRLPACFFNRHTRCGHPAAHRQRVTRYASIVLSVLALWGLLGTGCASRPGSLHDTETPYQPSLGAVYWKNLCPGADTADIYDARLPLVAHVVRIDLSHPSIAVVTSEASRFLDTGGRIKNETTQAFAIRRNTIAAFNGAPFNTRSLLFSMYDTITGIHITDFRQMSMPNPRYGALLFYRDGTARIIDSQTEDAFSDDVRHAVGGFWTILREGRTLPQKLERRDSRTAVGLADGGTTLFIVAVEGENKRKSQGLSYTETAALMRELGASDALQLDGGSSSTLVLQQNGIQTVVAPDRIWNVHIPVAVNVGIVYTK